MNFDKKKYLSALAMFLLFFSSLVFAATESYTYLQQGYAKKDEGKLDEAIALYKKSFAIDQNIQAKIALEDVLKTKKTQQICEQVKKIALPTVNQINPNRIAVPKDCDSEASYYGMGQARNVEQARVCAYTQRNLSNESVFSGNAILMMLYANGEGVTKNIDLAERFACDIQGARAETEGRIERLEAMRTDSNSSKKIDLCDDITSGYLEGWCVNHDYHMHQFELDAKLNAFQNNWTTVQKATFKKLQAAAEDFALKRSHNEIDQSSTAAGALVIEEKGIQKKDFIQSLQWLEKNKAPRYSTTQLKEEDKKLNEQYGVIQNQKTNPIMGTITLNGIKDTQKSWIRYRDAWIEFAKSKYPNCTSDSIAAWFTKKRNHMLKAFLK